MTLKSVCDELNTTTQKILDLVDELQRNIARLPDVSIYEAQSYVRDILALCNEGLRLYQTVQSQLESVQVILGKNNSGESNAFAEKILRKVNTGVEIVVAVTSALGSLVSSTPVTQAPDSSITEPPYQHRIFPPLELTDQLAEAYIDQVESEAKRRRDGIEEEEGDISNTITDKPRFP